MPHVSTVARRAVQPCRRARRASTGLSRAAGRRHSARRTASRRSRAPENCSCRVWLISKYVVSRSTNRASPRCSAAGLVVQNRDESRAFDTSTCDTPLPQDRARDESASTKRPVRCTRSRIGHRSAARGRDQAVDDRQIEIAILRAELVDDRRPCCPRDRAADRGARSPSARARRPAARRSTAARAESRPRPPTVSP